MIHLLSIISLCHLLTLSCNVFAQSSNETIRAISFNIKPSYVPLAETLPPHTVIQRIWPKAELRTDLPNLIPAIVVQQDGYHDGSLMGPPIHIQAGDRLQLSLKNEVPYTGLSIHLHGFEMSLAFEYDGAIGISQCPLSEGNTFTYNILANETPGTYWYHTQSGHMGVDAFDAVRGPLIVHPKGVDEQILVDRLNDSENYLQLGYSLLAYGDERILFFQDGFLSSGSRRYSHHIGDLYGPASKDDEGFIAATTPWEFGTCNGKLRDIIHVASNRKYKFRLINGGSHHALRISIGSFPMTVVAADSEPVEAYTVDEVILHAGERFDVEINIYGDIVEDERFWIRADTLESASQGYQSGIRAIMRVSTQQLIPPTIGDAEVIDPSHHNFHTLRSKDSGWKTLNCHSEDKSSGCNPITVLSYSGIGVEEGSIAESEIHTVDTHSQPSPQYGHFVKIDDSYFKQNELPPVAMLSHKFRTSENSIHSNSVAMGVSRSSSIIIVWRTTLLMDHPIHLHGHKVEILDIAYPTRRQDCTLSYCKLSDAYDSQDRIKSIDRTPRNSVVRKDTFVIPAGGAVVTRFQTNNRGLWLAHGQMDVHDVDGMSFVMNVGDYRIPENDDWLPADFPTCNSTLAKSAHLNPACECYVDKNAPLRFEVANRYFCSRAHLCRHVSSQAANLDSFTYEKGLNIQSALRLDIPEVILTTVFFMVVVTTAVLILRLPSLRSTTPPKRGGRISQVLRRLSQRSDTMSARIRNAQLMLSSIDVRVNSVDNDDGSMLGMSRVSEEISSIESIESSIGDDSDNDVEGESTTVEDSPEEREPSLPQLPLPPPPPLTRKKATNCPSTLALEEKQLSLTNNSQQRSSLKTTHIGEIVVRKSVCSQQQPPRSRQMSSMTNRSTFSSTFERIFSERGSDTNTKDKDFKHVFVLNGLDGYHMRGKIDVVPVNLIVNRGSSFVDQLFHLLRVQWNSYFRSCVNPLRVVEVIGLALITGGVFSDVASDKAGISQIYSLVLVSTTIWTFSRMYPAIPSHHEWFQSAQILLRYRRFSVSPVYAARLSTVLLLESIWPTIFTFICFPVAGLAGDITSLCRISFLLAANNVCYLSLGMVLGVLTQSSPFGMIAATIISQGSIIGAGIFTTLPPSLEWVRYFSPYYWTIQGLLKSVYRWTDTYDCVSGSGSDVGANQCFIEYDPLIDNFKGRGVHVASYNDASSDSVITEAVALVALSCFLHVLMFLKCFFAYYRVNWDEISPKIERMPRNHLY